MNMSPIGVSALFPPEKDAGKQNAGKKDLFSEVLNSALKKINETQIKADNLSLGVLTGEVQDIHQATIAMQEAKLSMQLIVEVRNKVIEAYQEMLRMQV